MKIPRTIAIWTLLPSLAVAASIASDSPGAARRTNGMNFKDWVLASCLAKAYSDQPVAAKDARATASALMEWTYFDVQKASSSPDNLVEKYLRRDYRNPLEGFVDVRFELLKCLDLYHSHELDAEVGQFVPHPTWVGRSPGLGPRTK